MRTNGIKIGVNNLKDKKNMAVTIWFSQNYHNKTIFLNLATLYIFFKSAKLTPRNVVL